MTLKNIVAFVAAYACDEHGDGPNFAKIIIDQKFSDQLTRLRKLAVDNNLTELRVSDCPEYWGPGDIEDDLRLSSPELVITKTDFWFVDQPKHADYHIETRAQNIDVFLEALQKGVSPVYIGDADLQERVLENEKEPA